jgi:PAS domain S-box-containing protein
MNMIVSASVLLSSCAAFIGYEWVTFKNTAAEHLSTDADIAGIDVTPALLFDDAGAATESLAALRAMPNITGAAVYRSDGRLFAKYVRGTPGAATALPERLELSRNTHRLEDNQLIVSRQILSDHKPIGMIYIQSDLKEIEQRLRGYAVIVFAVLGASFAVALVVSSVLQRKISGPILSLTETARVVAVRRDYSVRASVESKDETGILGQAFNNMLLQIKEQNDTLQESERSFRQLANAMPQIVFTASAEGNAEYFNQKVYDYAGTVAGQSEILNWRSVIHPDDLEKYIEEWRKSVQTGAAFNMECRIRRASDGVYRWHLARALPVRDKEGHVTRWFGTYTDIDDQKKAEAEIREINAVLERRVAERTEKLTVANQELAKANEAKDRFLAAMSHELRTPLNAIIGFTGTLLMKLPGPLTPDQDSQLQAVRGSARHLLSLINDLLDLARIESGKVELNFEPVSCRSVVNEVATALAPLAEAKGLRFEVVLPEDDVVVPTDSRALSQIVINLTNNAIKFTDKGFIRVEVRKLDTARPRVELSVTDTGIGITEEDQKKLFRAFERAHGSIRRRFEGTGLGLHLSQKLAALLGGEIVCHSEYGNGSSFSLTL